MLPLLAEQKLLAQNGIRTIQGAGAPTNGTTGAGDTGPGSEYVDRTNNTRYINIGTLASPVWLELVAGATRTAYRRFTIAEINAGATLLPAIAGYKYRMVDAMMIAVGGAVGATTTVDILATQAAGSVKLLAVAIAALTQSTLVRGGTSANTTILANGASHSANDANTAITVGKTGATATTATHVDVIFHYQIEKA